MRSNASRIKNLTNRQFGRLTVLSLSGRDNQGRATWLCRCSCGIEKVVCSRHLVNGATVSCSCIFKESSPAAARKGAWKHSGPLCHLYKSELTDEQRALRRDYQKSKEWRRAVFARDDYTCQICRQRSGRLAAHHLNCWSAFPDERFDLDNGACLCVSCHQAFHQSVGGWSKTCTKSDFVLFKEIFVIDVLSSLSHRL